MLFQGHSCTGEPFAAAGGWRQTRTASRFRARGHQLRPHDPRTGRIPARARYEMRWFGLGGVHVNAVAPGGSF
ncbi:hypothetical protein SCATT_17970 [Streptantibioticus cattleyicolor NRRL 8057 = DSM 46488]|uniref:Uncharacterized protein n=1 Tax=Streptantibioticus cattleyicolor (strain ATCC 35852 / DSM 46488 / JCM 4925 / NBRC 14057 / NRRL 8057) TaxID=1003195 RepID=G8WQA8_STREN|nr:hypothetical protein SCATT_17970 [Streptantibioticus cattleyicolor NRRL 8057 = DSM 46488]